MVIDMICCTLCETMTPITKAAMTSGARITGSSLSFGGVVMVWAGAVSFSVVRVAA